MAFIPAFNPVQLYLKAKCTTFRTDLSLFQMDLTQIVAQVSPKCISRNLFFFFFHNWGTRISEIFDLIAWFWIFGVSLIAQSVENLPAVQETGVHFLGQEDPLERRWQPTPVFLPGESHGEAFLTAISILNLKICFAGKRQHKAQ